MMCHRILSSLLAVMLLSILTEAFITPNARRYHSSSSFLRMDMEGDRSSFEFERNLIQQRVTFDRMISKHLERDEHQSIIDAKHAYGMPWKTSIKRTEDSSPPLLYMPFWEWQMSFMKENLSNLRVVPCLAKDSASYPDSTEDFSYNDNHKKGARIVNLCFESDEYRKIRMTYYDAGEGCQVFNSLWYPRESYNLPLLGIDLLAFNRKKYLGIVDFQPIHDNEDDHAVSFEQDVLKPIRDQYPSLHGKMSAKFYDETQFFSKQMLFARFEDEAIVDKDLLPAFQDYVMAHVDLVKETEPKFSSMEMVKDRQSAYDTYSADRDPATGLFASMFGKEWADEFVYGFLFSQSEKPEEGIQQSFPGMGGGNPQQQKQQQRQKQESVKLVR